MDGSTTASAKRAKVAGKPIWPKVPAEFVRAMLAGHSALGLAFAALIYLVCFSGSVAVFTYEYGRWEQPAGPLLHEVSPEAADAAFAAARPGVTFRSVHEAAMRVIAERTAEWGLLPVTAEEALDADRGGQHRRYVVHGTSHHLGIDVHDCAQARREMY